MIQKSICKINIGLDIVSRRSDGYHNIESLFYPVHSLYDLVEVVRSEDDGMSFSQSGITVDCDAEDNLCVKAYRAFSRQFPIGGVKIHLHKMIPFGAGIGGGSANAATVICMLNTIFATGATSEQLCSVAKSVGSDVPFFIYNTPLMVSGVGDIFTPTHISLTDKHITIIKPNDSVSTKDAYSRITPCVPSIPLTDRLNGDWQGGVINGFECATMNERMYEIKSELYALGASYVSMSGSGSAIFAISDFLLPLPYYEEFTHQGILK